MAEPTPLDDYRLASRRTLLTGALVAGAVPLLAACGSDDDSGSADDAPTSETASSEETSSSPETSAGEDTGSGGAEPVVVAAVADVPEGGGIVLTDEELVVTQPTAGQFRGFTSICTHQGCPVGEVADGTINCPCHGSMFDIETGEVIGGPAPAPLGGKPIIVEGKDILLASD